jgi:hypothetical protein
MRGNLFDETFSARLVGLRGRVTLGRSFTRPGTIGTRRDSSETSNSKCSHPRSGGGREVIEFGSGLTRDLLGYLIENNEARKLTTIQLAGEKVTAWLASHLKGPVTLTVRFVRRNIPFHAAIPADIEDS